MENVREICVFAASSGRVGKQYMEAAYQLGQAFAAAGIACINGGGRDGLMRAVSDGTLDGGGRAVGIIPQFMVDNGWQYDSLRLLSLPTCTHASR